MSQRRKMMCYERYHKSRAVCSSTTIQTSNVSARHPIVHQTDPLQLRTMFSWSEYNAGQEMGMIVDFSCPRHRYNGLSSWPLQHQLFVSFSSKEARSTACNDGHLICQSHPNHFGLCHGWIGKTWTKISNCSPNRKRRTLGKIKMRSQRNLCRWLYHRSSKIRELSGIEPACLTLLQLQQSRIYILATNDKLLKQRARKVGFWTFSSMWNV